MNNLPALDQHDVNSPETGLPHHGEAAEVPGWYTPAEAATCDPGGHWVQPLAAGLHMSSTTISIVVLHHRTFAPAYIRELPRDGGMKQLHGCLTEAARTLADFNLLLCCAIEPSTFEASRTAPPFQPHTPWLWVRYPHPAASGPHASNQYLDNAKGRTCFTALAMATRLQEDLYTPQEFDQEFRHLRALTGAMQRMKRVLLTRLPPDMRRIASLGHDLSF